MRFAKVLILLNLVMFLSVTSSFADTLLDVKMKVNSTSQKAANYITGTRTYKAAVGAKKYITSTAGNIHSGANSFLKNRNKSINMKNLKIQTQGELVAPQFNAKRSNIGSLKTGQFPGTMPIQALKGAESKPLNNSLSTSFKQSLKRIGFK